MSSAAAKAQTLVHDRIVSVGSGRVALADAVNVRARASEDKGLASAAMPLPSMTLRFSLSDAQVAALSALEIAQQNPSSAEYHKWLTPEQYGTQFGINDGDLTQVTAWLAGQGFTGIAVARSRSFVTFSGTAGQVGAAFGAGIHQLRSADGAVHFGNLSAPVIPAGFAGVVASVTGLNDYHLKSHVKVRSVVVPEFTSSISGNHYIAPGDFYTIYNTSPLLNSSINGSGVTIGVMGQTDISLADVAAFRSASGLPANAPMVKVYGTDPGTSSNDLPEASLDVEWSGAVAPSATILYVNSTDVIAGSLTQAIDNNVAPILTISYGDCESGFGAANITTYNRLLQQATVQGQTVVGPAGDSGATDCDYDATTATQGLAVDFPASSPYVTGVGGTEFNEGGGTYFSTTNGAYSGSALSYIPEMVWNETALGGGLAAGGGGASMSFTKPTWQVGSGVPADASRDVPDVSFNAAASHDGYLFCVSGNCTNGYRNSSNGLDVVGGTSVSTPAYAGILALLEQKIQMRVGNANPTIYALANSTYYTTVFHDVTVGNNASPCTQGTVGCPNGGSIGYSATVGYDLASGWGSVDATQMVADWLLVTPLSVGATNTTSTTVTESASSVTAGTPVTLNVAVASTTSGVTTTPTGTVQLLVDGTASGNAVTLSATGTASLTVVTTGFSSGAHTLTAAYSGSTLYAGSKGNVTLDIVSTTAADFALSPASGSITVASGSTSAPLIFTVTPVNGFTGSVVFTAASVGGNLYATTNFTVNPVVISGTGTGSTSFSLTASASSNANPILKTAQTGSGSHPWGVAGSGVALAGLLCFLLPGRRRRIGALTALVLTLGMLSASGCSQGGNSLSTPITLLKTTPGTYQVLITATKYAGSTVVNMHTSTLTVVIQ